MTRRQREKGRAWFLRIERQQQQLACCAEASQKQLFVSVAPSSVMTLHVPMTILWTALRKIWHF